MPRLFAAVLLAVLLVPTAAHSASLDPALKWHTIDTDQFIIHYYEGEELIAARVAQISGPVFDKVTTAVGWQPKGKIHVVITDETDSANGFASTVPNNMIRLFVTAPTPGSSLDLYSDWVEMLFTHELTHIVHIDMIGGLPKALRYVFGTIVDYNQMQPRWVVEGYATYLETQLTQGGRGRSTFTEMILRAAVLEDEFPDISQGNGEMVEWPGGYVPYLFGVSFLQYLRETYGAEKIEEYHRRYSSALIPYRLNWHAKKVFGKKFPALWKDWEVYLQEKYKEERARAVELELTEAEQITHFGRRVAGATFGPSKDDIKLIYSVSTGHRHAQIRLLKMGGKKQEDAKKEAEKKGEEIEEQEEGGNVLIERYFANSFSWSPDGKRVAFGSRALYQDFYSWGEIFTLGVEDKALKQITNGTRGRDPAYKPDGTEILFIANNLGNNDLALARIDETIRYLTDHRDFTQYATPRYSPDGASIALSAWFPGGYRDLVILDSDGTNARRITLDLHVDRDPTWSPDGKYLVFASDRSGIMNLYAYEPDAARYYRVTNVMSSAFQPTISPDEQWIVFQGYTAKGYDLFKMPYAPDTWKEIGWDYDAAVFGVGCTDGDFEDEEDASASTSSIVGGTNGASDREDCGPGVQVPRDLTAAGLITGMKAATTANVSEGIASDPEISFDETTDAEATEEVAEVTFPLLERPKKSDGVDLSPYNPRKYSAWGTLIPRYWFPGQFFVTESGATIGAFTGATDPIFRHSYSAWINYNTGTQYVGGGFGYSYNRYRSTFYGGANTYSVNYGATLARTYGVRRPGANPENANEFIGFVRLPEDYIERRINAYAGLFWSYKKRHFMSLRYRFENRENLNPLAPPTFESFIPIRGNFAGLSFGYARSDVQYYRYGISPTEGYRIGASVEVFHPYLGSSVTHPDIQNEGLDTNNFDKAVATFDARYYPRIPFTRHHVLALRGSGGFAVGDTFFPPTFRLGGALGESALTVTTANYYSLRGYPFFAAIGEAFVIGSAEYRAPVWRIDRGLWTWPVFLRNVHAAAFLDVGDAFDYEFVDGGLAQNLEPKVGAGLEIRGNFNFFYYFPITVRAGYAIGLGTLRQNGAFDTEDNGFNGGVESFYWTLGTSF